MESLSPKKHLLMDFPLFLKARPPCVLHAGTVQRKHSHTWSVPLQARETLAPPCPPFLGRRRATLCRWKLHQHLNLTLTLLVL